MLKNIEISGYKSIDYLSLPVERFGKSKSYATFFIGKNECGKSNILEAISAPYYKENKVSLNFSNLQNSQNEPEEICVKYYFDICNKDFEEYIQNIVEAPDSLLKKIKITDYAKTYTLDKGSTNYGQWYDFNMEEVDVGDFVYKEIEKGKKYVINKASDLDDDELAEYIQLTMDELKDIIGYAVNAFDDSVSLPVDVWRSSENHLINGSISLPQFIQTFNNVPLKNMFKLIGCVSNEDIINKINDIKSNTKKRNKLEKLLSDSVTDYLNERWKEHPINIFVEIDSNLNLSVFVKDKCDSDNPFFMEDRSQGFKQFVSLLLSISITHYSNELKQHIIIIDEPEVHLHPSGIRWMMKELLEIGRDNYVFVATHSNFMIDSQSKERHYLVKKDKSNLTQIVQIKDDLDLFDEEVLFSAFGINVLNDFLTERKLLVEGKTDRIIFRKVLDKIDKHNRISISNGAGSNLVSVASIMNFHDVLPLIIVDADKSGRRIKSDVIKINETFRESTFTIRDMVGEFKNNATIEDAYPFDFVRSVINKQLNEKNISKVSLDESFPYIAQTFSHVKKEYINEGKSDKEAEKVADELIAQIKLKLSEYDVGNINNKKNSLFLSLGNKIIEFYK